MAKGSAKKAVKAEEVKVDTPVQVKPAKVEKKKKEKVAEKGTENKENKEQSIKSAKKEGNKEGKKEEKTESPVVEAEPIKPKEVKFLLKPKIVEGSSAFMKQLEGRLKKEENDLLDAGTKKIQLQVSGIKLPADSDKCTIKSRLPHNCLAADADVLLIVKDNEKGIKPDHEATLLHYKGLLQDNGVKNISEVMPMRQLRVEYKDFEAKVQLCNRFDKVLVDDRIIRLIPQFLGGCFYKKGKFPVAVNLKKKNVKEEIDRCISTELMPLKNHGSCASITVGNSCMDAASLAANTEVAVRAIETRYPGGWKNVRSLHFCCSNTSLPLYLTSRTAQEVGKVETFNFAKNVKKSVRDELSTIPGATVIVHPSGDVKLKRSADEEWDEDLDIGVKKTKKQRRAEEKAEREKEAKEAAKEKEKLEQEAKDAKKKTTKKGAKEEEEESEDEMEDMEKEYMRKVAEEEEEIERKEQENMEKLGGSAKAADGSDSEADGSEADDDIEADNLVSGDEEEDNEDAILMDKTSDVELDDDEEAPKKKKKSKKEKKKKAKLDAKVAEKKDNKKSSKAKGGKANEGKKKKSK